MKWGRYRYGEPEAGRGCFSTAQGLATLRHEVGLTHMSTGEASGRSRSSVAHSENLLQNILLNLSNYTTLSPGIRR
jgi:hypothetical protein